MAKPERKALRLPDFDYSASGAYFVTVCTQKRRCILSDISVGAIHESPAVQLTKMGLIVKSMIDTLPDRFENLAVDAYVIMPNHIHLLLQIEEGAIHESPLRKKGTRSLLGKAIGYLKMNSSKRIHECHPSLEIWQRG